MYSRPYGFDYQFCYTDSINYYFVLSRYPFISENDTGYLASDEDSSYILGNFTYKGDFLYKKYRVLENGNIHSMDFILPAENKDNYVCRILYEDLINPVTNQIVASKDRSR